jgi:hypothetical protein
MVLDALLKIKNEQVRFTLFLSVLDGQWFADERYLW